jgi:hypothetical protein
MFREFLNDIASHNSEDLCVSLEITPQEAAQGAVRIIPLSSNMPCSFCQSQGVLPGMFRPQPCQPCSGQGVIPCRKDFQACIPAGIQSGAVLPFPGHGRYSLFAQSRGDLYVQVKIKADAPLPFHHHAALPATVFPPNAPTIVDASYQPAPSLQNVPTLANRTYQPASRSGIPTQLGNYRILQLLGSGGDGIVYLGQHIHLDTLAAVKVLQPMGLQDVQRFLHEARTLASLKHPHILRVLDFGTEGTTPFLVIDYAPSGTLRERHPNGSSLPLHQVRSYVKQIASALQYAHHQRIVHRDVKPENMLVDQEMVLLSDFGIAVSAHHTRTMTIEEPYGTARYIAPEQLEGHPRPASDQYALAVVVYEWLCGTCPFDGTTQELIRQHLHIAPLPLRQHIPTLSPGIEQVVLKALSKDPHHRFDSVQSFALALECAI